MKCTNLRCEYQINPMGIDTKRPRMSWQIESDKHDVIQQSYKIQCSSDETFNPDSLLWDTGMVLSRKSNQITYEGASLVACRRVYWRVMVETNVGNSSYSDVVFFEMGLLDKSWDGKWITPSAKFETNSQCPVLKKKFVLDEEPISARLYITALGMYETNLNNNRVDQDLLAPGWTSYNHHLQYQTYDVTSMLVAGNNIISVTLGSGWYKGRLAGWIPDKNINKYGDTAALLAQLVITYVDGSSHIIKTDNSWKCGKSAILMSEIYDGEIYDASHDDTIEFIPFDELENCRLYNSPNKFKIIGQNTPGVRVIDEIVPDAIITTPKGDTVIDFGQNMVGWVKVKAKGVKGDEIYLKHGEIMLNDEFYNKNMRSAKTEAVYILKGEGTETFEPHFTFFGFRYVKLEKYPGVADINDFKGIVISSNLEYGGAFQCSNDKVNKLYQNILWGQKGNFVDVPTDCPQRDERLGWTGDTQIFAATACYNALSASFYSKWLKDVAYDQLSDGRIPSVVPDVLRDGIASSAWGDATTIVPNIVYDFYKDKEVLKNQYDSMKKWVEYIRTQGENEALWNTGFHFNDWLAKDGFGVTEIHGGTPMPLVATAMYYNSVKLLAKSAGILDYTEDEEQYSRLAEKIKKTFNLEFVTPSGRISGETQTSYTLALHFDLLDEDKKDVAAYHLAELVRNQKHQITTGFVGTAYITHVLSNNGYNNDAYKMLLNEECPGWLYPVTMGATTIWERWDSMLPDGNINPDGMNSFNHYAYGCIAQWLFAQVLGITPYDGFEIFNIAPKPSGLLSMACGGIETMYGRIESSWKINNSTIELEFLIPCNTKAKVTLPFAKIGDISYYKDVTPCKDGLRIILGSGKYSFSYTNDCLKEILNTEKNDI